MRWGAGRSFNQSQFDGDTFQIMGFKNAGLVRDLEGNLFLREICLEGSEAVGINAFEISFADACRWIGAHSNWSDPAKLLLFHGIAPERPSRQEAPKEVMSLSLWSSTENAIIEEFDLPDDLRDYFRAAVDSSNLKIPNLITAALRLAIQRSGANPATAARQLPDALDDLAQIQNETNFMVESIIAAFRTWNADGQMTKECAERREIGFMTLWRRLDELAGEKLSAALAGLRQCRMGGAQ